MTGLPGHHAPPPKVVHYKIDNRTRNKSFSLRSIQGYNHHMVTLYLNGNPPWLKVFGDDQKPRVVLVTVLTSLILLLYDGLMVSDIHLKNIFSPNPDFYSASI